MRRKRMYMILQFMIIAGLLTGCYQKKETEQDIREEVQVIETVQQNEESETTSTTLESEEKEGLQNNEDEKEEVTTVKEQRNKNDKFFGAYDETKLSFVEMFEPAWFVLQNWENQYLTLMEPVKGDAYCIVINDKGVVLNEGITDSMYGESYITEYEGETAIVNIYGIDEENHTYHAELKDMNGNVIVDLEENYVYNEEEEWYDIEEGKYPYLEGVSRVGATENEKVQLELTDEGLRVKDLNGNEIAFFQNEYPKYQPISQEHTNAMYGELIGDFLFVYQIAPIEGADYDNDKMWIYKIL